MKKVLSVALASAMVLGMGANAFAISYSTGSNQEADWPSNFQFDGELFVTDKDGDIIEESTTELNDSESVDFEPGDTIWMPLYADDQYVWHNTYTKGEDGADAVSSIRLGEGYFSEGSIASNPTGGTQENVVEDVPVSVVVDSGSNWANNSKVTVTVGGTNVGRTKLKNVDTTKKTGTVTITLDGTEYNAIFGGDAATFTGVAVTLNVAENVSVTNSDVVIGVVKTPGTNGTAQAPATLNSIPTTIEVEDEDGNLVERTVESAKAVVNGKTFTEKAKNFSDLISDVNDELDAMAKAGKSALIKDVVVTLNLAEKKATDDVVNKPHIEVADDDKVMVDYGHYTGNIDKNWSINLIEKSTGVAELIEKAELYKATATDYASYSKYTDEIMPNAVYLKITLKDEWKTVDEETLTYYVYVADNDNKNNKTNEVWVSGTYVNNDWEYVDFTWTNNAAEAQLWKVKKGENGTAVFDFADKAFFTVKMYSGESMYLDLSTAYDKAIAGEMDAEADSFYKFDNENANFSRTGELIIVTDDSSLVPYEIDEDGNFVEVDAKYVEDYAIAHTNKKVNGFVFSTKTLGNYVLSTEELGQEQPAEETPAKPVTPSEPTQETPAPETSKPNPATGAEDFVGLAVSLAVVSVAAAGALALKK